MNQFVHKNRELFCEEVNLKEIAAAAGTPVYVYSKKMLVDSFKELDNAFAEIDHKIFYSMKANSNLNVARILYKAGAGLDCNSGGEVFRALKAGADPKNIILAGVGKNEDEIQYALENNILMFKVESDDEIRKINKIAGEMKKIAPIGIRINPNVDAKTHPYISTGLAENKFGIDSSLVLEIFNLVKSLPNLIAVGIDTHIGSQITSIEPFVETAERMAEITLNLKKNGIEIKHLDIGGGLGIRYKDEEPITPKAFADAVIPKLKAAGCRIIIEPGRFISANAGILLSKVIYTKKNKTKNFIIIDGGMNDLIRPALYGAHHHVQCVDQKNGETISADIVGPVCESSDFFGKEREICKLQQDDLVAVMSAGAYGYVMSSNYNSRTKAPEVIVDEDKFYIVTGRENYEDLIRKEKLFDELI